MSRRRLLGNRRSGGSDSLLEGLVAYYSLGETTGQYIDKVGGNNGTSQGTETRGVSGKVGLATKFNNGAPVLLDSSNISGLPQFTIAFWFQMNGLGNLQGFYGSNPYSFALSFHITQLRMKLATENGSVDTNFSIPSIGTLIWYCAIFEYDGANMRLTFNNVESTTVGSHTGTPIATTREVIGGRRTTQEYLQGAMDELSIWNRILTPEEKTTIWNNGNNGIPLIP